MLTIQSQSSLEKIFPDTQEFQPAYVRGSCLGGEAFSYQLAVKWDGWGGKALGLSVDSPLQGQVRLFRVGCVPCQLPAYPGRCDGRYITTKPGLFPDVLAPIEDGRLEVSGFCQTVVWVEVAVPQGCPAGEYPISIKLEGEGEQGESAFTLEVVGESLPKQELLYTQWVHGDCLCHRYGLEAYSEAYWALLGKYLAAAAEEGMNMVLTPVFTPALDTEVGGERLCTQLLDIRKEGAAYAFGFSRLERFIQLAQGVGITHFEVSHLFTQWGAGFAPAIYAEEGGVRRRVFGWDTPADSPAYRAFLAQALPALTGFFRDKGLAGHVVFHISDEPEEKCLDSYRRAREGVVPYLEGFPLYDALSERAFYDKGLVEHPIAATDHIGPFLEAGAPGLWAYTCCSQNVDVGNRFLAMPSYRNRVLGWQLFKYDIAGFLHWGYNFWATQNSRAQIDPYQVTDAGRAFPGGDPFSVYPGPDGPVKSLRMKVFQQGLQDLRALRLLEGRLGRGRLAALLPGFEEMTFARYPHSGGSLLAWREAVNRAVGGR